MSDRSEGSGAVGVGVIGCGDISHAYIENMQRSPRLRVIACGDDPPDRARERAREYGVARSGTPEEVMSDPAVELVVNLTVPARHSGVTLGALRTGKHVWSEKPLGLNRQEGAEILKEAEELGLEVGCAPDTILGAGLQTCRRAVSEGLIGEPLAASAFFMAAGPELWHHHPSFFYEAGAGPLFDVGPYYLSALVQLLGPVRRVTASGSVLFPERTIQAGPRRGQTIRVATNTFVAGVLEFEEGAMSTLVTAFGVWGGDVPPALVFGSKGVLALPDPNTFGGPVQVRLHADQEGWRELPLTHHHTDGCQNCRGLGVAEMAVAIRAGARPRASAQLAYHVVDVMQSMAESEGQGRHIEVQSRCQRSEPLPVDARFFA